MGMTALVGICGTFSAGLFAWYVLHRHGAGLLLSLLFSMLLVWIHRRSHAGPSRRRASVAVAAGSNATCDCGASSRRSRGSVGGGKVRRDE